MVRLLVLLAIWMGAWLVPASAFAASPAGYVISFDLQGADREPGTVIARSGEEIKPKLWMPIFAGDVVFVRDPQSRITLDMGADGRIDLGGTTSRYTAKGEIETGDDAWSIITKIGGILAGGGESVVPTNLASKGDGSIIALQASKGPNFIAKNGGALVVYWRGGKGPYKLALESDGKQMLLPDSAVTSAEIMVPEAMGGHFDLLIADTAGNHVRMPFRIRDAIPKYPKALTDAGPSQEFDDILLAGWLAERPRGAWKVEALRRLKSLSVSSAAASKLMASLVTQF